MLSIQMNGSDLANGQPKKKSRGGVDEAFKLGRVTAALELQKQKVDEDKKSAEIQTLLAMDMKQKALETLTEINKMLAMGMLKQNMNSGMMPPPPGAMPELPGAPPPMAMGGGMPPLPGGLPGGMPPLPMGGDMAMGVPPPPMPPDMGGAPMGGGMPPDMMMGGGAPPPSGLPPITG